MQIAGFAYDYQRAAGFSERCRDWEADALKRCDDAAGQQLPRTKTGGISDNTLRSLLIDSWRAPVVMLTSTTKKPAMHVDAMTCYAAMANRQLAGVARAVLEWRRLRKIRSTYLDPIEVGADGRVHASWHNYGTVSGRFSCIAAGTPVEVLRDVDLYPTVPIEEVKVGDFVHCFVDGVNTVRKVLRAECMGVKRVMRLRWRGAGNHHTGHLDLTHDHRVMLTSGMWMRADELKVGDRVMAVHRATDAFGYQRIWATGSRERKEHRIVCAGEHVHHKNGRKSDNRPENLEAMTRSQHLSLHGSEISDELRAKRSANASRPWTRRRHDMHVGRVLTISHAEAHAALEKSGWRIKAASKLLGHDYMAFRGALVRLGFDVRAIVERTKRAATTEWRRKKRESNHTIIGIEELADPVVTYDLEVEEAHNFIAGELCVHNCGDPNLMNLPKKTIDPFRKEGGIRSLYIAQEGYTLVALDRKQLEMRVAAHASGDEAMMAACEGSDLHSANAAAIFGSAMNVAEYARLSALKEAGGSIPAELKDDYDRWYGLRNMAKTAGFAVCYLAEAETVHARILASGGNIKLAAVVAMLEKMKRGFAAYYKWQDTRLLACVRNGWTDSPILGRRRWLGHEPSPTECANFPIQSGAADIMNGSLPAIDDAMARLDPRIRLVAQVHDNLTFEVPIAVAQDAVAELTRICHTPVALDTSGRRLEAVFPIDIGASERWS